MQPSTSPYARVLGERFHDLHPALQSYFSGVAVGSVGTGEGIFDRIGTPRRWLWPLLAPLHRYGVVWAGWGRSVPFRVENRTCGRWAIGMRVFHLPGSDWIMRDAVTDHRGRIVDALGEPRTADASFDLAVHDGALVMTSVAIGLRVGGRRIRVPTPFAPRLQLTEHFDTATGRQHVAFTMDLPVIGRIYEYSGAFVYRTAKGVTP